MSHDEDVRLLVLDLCQQCLDSVGCDDCKHFDDSLETGGCSLMHRILALTDALMEEHEAVKAWTSNEWDADEDFDEYQQRDNALILARNAAYDKVEGILREGR
jgi:hypothetical protein